MALVHAVSNVAHEENIFFTLKKKKKKKKAGFLLLVCRIYSGLQLDVHNESVVIPQMLTSSVNFTQPLDNAADHCVYENGFMIQMRSLPAEHPLTIKCVACFCALIFRFPLKMHHALQILFSSLCNTSFSITIWLLFPLL